MFANKSFYSKVLFVICAGASLASWNVFAENTSPTNTPGAPGNAVQQAPSYRSILDQIEFKHFEIVRGAPLSDLGSRFQPNADGTTDTDDVQNIESVITTGWRYDKDLSFGISTHFYFSPLGNPSKVRGVPDGRNPNMMWLDPSLYVSKANMINSNGWKLKGQLFVAYPMSQYDTLQKNGHVTSFSPTAIVTYDVPNTRWTLGCYNFLTYYIPGSDAVDGYRTFKFYMGPNVNYQILSNFAATLWIDAFSVKRPHGTNFWSGLHNDESDIEPGVNWDVAPWLSINPQLNIYPAKMTMSATSFYMILSGKFL